MFYSDYQPEQDQFDAMLLDWVSDIHKNAAKKSRQILGVNESFATCPDRREHVLELSCN